MCAKAMLGSAGVTTARRLHHGYEDYLAALEMSEVKLEYLDGEIYAMAGGTPAHAYLAAAAIRLLSNALLGRCRVSTSDLKIQIEATGLSTFPDISVVCGEPELARIDRNAVTNPSLLVEVTSKSTEDYDRGEKLNHYQQCPSLRAVLFVSHRRPQVTVVSRNGAGWDASEYRPGQRVQVPALALDFSLDELYAGIALDES
jgi:Uma2 family endonuclease